VLPDTGEYDRLAVINAGFTYPSGWKVELTLMLVMYLDGLPVHRQSPIQVLTT